MANMIVTWDSLSSHDIQYIKDYCAELVDEGSVGELMPLATENGEQVVAVLTPDNSNLLCAFGKVSDWYCAIDANSNLLAQSKGLGELFGTLSQGVFA